MYTERTILVLTKNLILLPGTQCQDSQTTWGLQFDLNETTCHRLGTINAVTNKQYRHGYDNTNPQHMATGTRIT